MSPWMGYVGAVLNGLGFVLYFRELLVAKKTVSTLGWFLSAVIVSSTAIVHFGVTGNFSQSMSYFVGVACCWGIFALSLRSKPVVGKKDWWTMVSALAIGGLTFFDEGLTLYCLVVYYLLTYSVFLRSVWAGNVEPLIPWGLWVGAAACQISSLILSSSPFTAVLLPATNLLCWGAVLLASVFKKTN